ncbi:unnamed protein product [Adineta ricciae]|uniref:ARC105/Med15 mediator subunit C-terminal domain-containing protein n=1 Tax=Adineta ricciae TaxID=249248 RepID=A0A814TGH3_ADIRI|nr:unnamed protein product [Adineta ricciae]CAF1161880.1 unnamed protein product [Adineta ricciae]
MMNSDGSAPPDDQQRISDSDRENFIARLTNIFGGNRELALNFDEDAFNRSGGKLLLYRRVLQALVQRRNQQAQQQQQQQQQQTMMNSQGQQQMYMQPQPSQTSAMPQQIQQQQQLPPTNQSSYTMQSSTSMIQSTPMMNIKQEPQSSLGNIQARQTMQNLVMQQQQQQAPLLIKQEVTTQSLQQQQQQIGLQIPQMRPQQQQLQQPQQMSLAPSQFMHQQPQQQQPISTSLAPPQPAPPQPAPTPQRTLAQHLQQVRQQNHLNQQQQEPPGSSQLQQQLQPTNSSVLPQSSSSSAAASGSQDEILQHLLSSPNPPKQPPSTAQSVVQARLRNMNRNIRHQSMSTLQTAQQQQQQQQQQSPMASGADTLMTSSGVSSPHSHPGIIQQQATPLAQQPGQSPLARYMMSQSPQNSIYRPQMSPINMINYAGSPTVMIDDEIHFLYKYFNERIQFLTRIIARCQQEGQHEKAVKYRQLHEQVSNFVRNLTPEHLMTARRLKEHVDRMLGPMVMPQINDGTASAPPNSRLVTSGVFEQCQRTIVDYLSKNSTLKYNIAKRFLEPLSEVLNGVPHKTIRLDTECKQVEERISLSTNSHVPISMNHIIECEFAHSSMNTFSYELKPLHDRSSSTPSMLKNKDTMVDDYELTCHFIEIDMPLVPPLKLKLTVQYPNEPPEVLSLTSTAMSLTPTKLENSDGNTFFETISRNFVYFLFKLPTQHTVTDILDIWRTAIRNASLSQNDS